MQLLSIIIPTYNPGPTLEKTITSVLNQTYKNIELLIVDGASAEKTLKFLHSFKDDRIKITSEKDKGIYDAMNKGIKMAKGEWLYFLGSDDRFYDDKVVDDFFGFISSNACDVVYGNVYSTRFKGIYDGRFSERKIYTMNICHQAIFFNKNVFDTIGMFDLKYKAQADWDHNMKWWFAEDIHHLFYDRIIAAYSDGGFSSEGDIVFKENKLANYLMYSKEKLSLKKRWLVVKTELVVNVKKKNTLLLLKMIGACVRAFFIKH